MTIKITGLGEYHGSASDRGGADAYYWRDADPHYWPEGTYNGTRVEKANMTKEEIDAYMTAYKNQDSRKDWC